MNNNQIKLKGQFKNIFMEETAPQNPFGPNFNMLPYNAKIGYKFNRMKGFIRPTKQDLVYKEDQDGKFTGILLMGGVAGVVFGGLLRMVFKRTNPKINNFLGHFQGGYYAVILACSITQAYFRAYQRYYDKVASYFITKYTQQAIQNGFEDYQISK